MVLHFDFNSLTQFTAFPNLMFLFILVVPIALHRFAISKVEFLSGYIPFSSVKLINDCLLRAVATC